MGFSIHPYRRGRRHRRGQRFWELGGRDRNGSEFYEAAVLLIDISDCGLGRAWGAYWMAALEVPLVGPVRIVDAE